MQKISLKIDTRFIGFNIKDIYQYFHLGKEKIKKIKAYKNGNTLKDEALNLGDIISFEYEDKCDFIPYDKPLNIIYEDENFLIINKEKATLIHPDTKDNNQTLCNMVANYYLKKGLNISVKYAHRIDTDTTGIIIFTKDILTTSYMNYYISTHDVIREYLLICSGKFEKLNGVFDYPIAEDRHIANKKRVSFKTGKKAITNYNVIKVLKHNLNLCSARLENGRTHQIRLHFSYSGHPLIGDKLYNGNLNLMDRQALHSYRVKFLHPFSGSIVEFEAPIPSDMQKVINKYKTL